MITSFAVANAITVPLTGWLTQRFGQVRLFLMSTLLFVLASWLCGFSPSLEALIAFRVLQGAVAGPMIPLSQALMLASFPKSKAGMALAVWSMTTLVAPVAGPCWAAGFPTTTPGPGSSTSTCRSACWPPGSLAHLPRPRIAHAQAAIDKLGLVLLVVWVGALQIMLDKGKDWFASPTILILAAVAVGLRVLPDLGTTDAHPVVDLRLFKVRNFTVGALTLAVAYGVFFGNVVLLPLWLQSNMGYTATYAGLVTAPVGLLAILLTPVVGKMLATRDPRQIVTVAFLIFALVCFMRSGFNTQTDVRTLMTPTIIQGAAMAAFFVPLTSITLSSIEPWRIPAASGLSNFLRLTAGLRHLDRHHAMGKPRHDASRAADGNRAADRRPSTRRSARCRTGWACRTRSADAGGPDGQHAGLHHVRGGRVLWLGGDFPAVDRPGLVRPAQVREGGRRRGGSGGGSPLTRRAALAATRNEQTRPGGGSVANAG